MANIVSTNQARTFLDELHTAEDDCNISANLFYLVASDLAVDHTHALVCKVLEKSIDADSIVQAVEEGNQQQNPRDYLLNISVSISSYLNTSSVENELKEFVSYLKQELRAVRYQLSSNALAKTFSAKQIHEDAETRFHSLEEDVLEETDEEKCFRADFTTNKPKDTNTATGSRPTNRGRGISNSVQNGRRFTGNSPRNGGNGSNASTNNQGNGQTSLGYL